MAGISSIALNFGNPVNKYKFNGGDELQNNEFSDGSGLELYDAEHRMYDQQIGRFGQIDPLGDFGNNFSLYAFGSDNPILRNDPFGLKDTVVNGESGETKDLENVTLTTTKSKANYEDAETWVIGEMNLGFSPDAIADWSDRNTLFSDKFKRLVEMAASPAAVRYRKFMSDSHKRQEEFVKNLLLIAGSFFGSEAIGAVIEGFDGAAITEEATGDIETIGESGGVFEESNTTSVFHKGELNGGNVSSSRSLSTGLEKSSVEGLKRPGKVWEFRIPKNVLREWLDNGSAQTFKDVDITTGVTNNEIRFSSKLASEIRKYLLK